MLEEFGVYSSRLSETLRGARSSADRIPAVVRGLLSRSPDELDGLSMALVRQARPVRLPWCRSSVSRFAISRRATRIRS